MNLVLLLQTKVFLFIPESPLKLRFLIRAKKVNIKMAKHSLPGSKLATHQMFKPPTVPAQKAFVTFPTSKYTTATKHSP